jgi:hypothetical protein
MAKGSTPESMLPQLAVPLDRVVRGQLVTRE